MAEIDKTKHYGLTIFNSTQSTLTFSEFRKLIAGIGSSEDDRSNMELIDDYLNQLKIEIDNNFSSSKIYTNNAIEDFGQELDQIINNDGNNLTIGNGTRTPIVFNDGTQETYLSNGTLTVNKIKTEETRYNDYIIKRNLSNGHLQSAYKPTGGEQ